MNRKEMYMNRKKKFSLIKFLGIYFVYFWFRLWIFWVKHVSLESLGFYGEKFGTIAFHFLIKARKIALNNLHLALGSEKNEEEIKRICRDSFKNIGKDMMEISRCLDLDSKTFVKLEGKEYLDEALKQGKGVIALSAHLGNFPLMNVRLANEGYPLSMVIRGTKNPKIVKIMNSFIDAVGIEAIPDKPRTACIARCLKALKENRILWLQNDINAPGTEAWVDFFGYLVPAFKGPVIFSLRTRAPILPMFITRNAHHSHNLIISPPFELKARENNQEDITSNIAQLTKIIEGMIRKYPEQWWWTHRRFKRARDLQTGERLFHNHP
jgi:KDO2-lipid IV(A) lauroyltransferase